jgi:hypothetical protein
MSLRALMKWKCIYKRGKSFQVRVVLPDGRRASRAFPTLELAEDFRQACREGRCPDALRFGALGRGGAAAKVRTIKQLFSLVDKKRWSGNPDYRSHSKGSAGNALRFVEWIGPKTPVKAALSESAIGQFMDERVRVHENSGSTINRYSAALSCLVKEAMKLRLIDQCPELVHRREGRPRMRTFSEAEEQQLLHTVRAWGYGPC